MWPVFEVALRVQAKSVFQNWVFRSCSLISYCTVIFSWLCILRPWHIPSSSDVFHVNVNEDKIWYLWKKVGGGLGFIKCWNVKEIWIKSYLALKMTFQALIHILRFEILVALFQDSTFKSYYWNFNGFYDLSK